MIRDSWSLAAASFTCYKGEMMERTQTRASLWLFFLSVSLKDRLSSTSRCTLTWERRQSSRSSVCRETPPSAPTSAASAKWRRHIRSEQPGRRSARCRYSDRRGWCFQVWLRTCTSNTQRQIGTSSGKVEGFPFFIYLFRLLLFLCAAQVCWC